MTTFRPLVLISGVQSQLPTDGSIVVSGSTASGISNLQTVTQAGNTTTLDVKIGGTLPDSPNIELNANGSATFASGSIALNAVNNTNIVIGDWDNNSTTGGVRIRKLTTDKYGQIAIKANADSPDVKPLTLRNGGTEAGNELFYVTQSGVGFFANSAYVGGTTSNSAIPDNPSITLSGDGSADFAGGITATTLQTSNYDVTSASGGGCRAGTASFTAQRSSSASANSNMYRGYYGTEQTFAVNVDGSVQIGGPDVNVNPTIDLRADGSALFRGNIDVNGGAVVAYSGGFLDVYRPGQGGNGSIFRCYGDVPNPSGGTYTRLLTTRLYDGATLLLGNDATQGDLNLIPASARINLDGQDGTADFAGTVTAALDVIVGDVNNEGTHINSNTAGGSPIWIASHGDGAFWRLTNADQSEEYFVAASGGVQVGQPGEGATSYPIELNSDGTAQFTSNILCGAEPGQGLNVGTKLGASGFFTATRNDGGAVFNAYQQGSNTKTIELLSTGSGTFTQTVTSDVQFKTGDFTSSGVGTGNGVNITAGGKIFVYPNSETAPALQVGGNDTTTFRIVRDGTTTIGGTQLSADTSGANITLNPDGNITASGSITAGASTFNGNLRVYRPTTTPSAQLAVFKSDVGSVDSQKITFFAGGNASFIGNITAQDVNSQGNITSSGTIQVADGASFVSSSAVGTSLYTSGQGVFCRNVDGAPIKVAICGSDAESGANRSYIGIAAAIDASSADINTRLFSNGAGQFAGQITASTLQTSNYDVTSASGGGCRAGTASFTAQRSSSADASSNMYRGYYGNTQTYAVNVDGSVQIGGVINSAPNIRLNASGTASFGGETVSVATANSGIGGKFVLQRPSGVESEIVFVGYDLDGMPDYADSPNNAFAIANKGGNGTVNILVGDPGTGNSRGKFAIYNQNAASPGVNARIWGNGEAEFAGAINIANRDITQDDVRGIDLKLGTNSAAVCVQQTDAASDNNAIFIGHKGSQEIFKVQLDGSISAVNTTIQPISSERRLKENIVAIDSNDAWETIKSTPYYSYNFIGSEATTYGPMADEVPAEMIVQPMEEVVIEEAVEQVIGPKGKVLKEGKEAVTETRPRSDDEGPIRTYNNGMLQARLYTALQTALSRIEALEAELEQLKSKI